MEFRKIICILIMNLKIEEIILFSKGGCLLDKVCNWQMNLDVLFQI